VFRLVSGKASTAALLRTSFLVAARKFCAAEVGPKRAKAVISFSASTVTHKFQWWGIRIHESMEGFLSRQIHRISESDLIGGFLFAANGTEMSSR
jgi:hypothetical protein